MLIKQFRQQILRIVLGKKKKITGYCKLINSSTMRSTKEVSKEKKLSNCHNTKKEVYIVSYPSFKKIIGKKEKTGKLSMVWFSVG